MNFADERALHAKSLELARDFRTLYQDGVVDPADALEALERYKDSRRALPGGPSAYGSTRFGASEAFDVTQGIVD